MAYINRQTILKKLTAPNKRLDTLTRNLAQTDVINEKENLINNFKNHEVSQELMGNGSEDGSAFLSGRSGNLRALIGFYPNDNPVGQLEKLLRNGIFLKNIPPQRSRSQSLITYRFSVRVPSLAELYEQTPYPDSHSSGSWLRGIEKGVPNLRYYLFSTIRNFKNSRSGPAIQSQKIVKNTPSKMTGIKYISELLENFKNSFSN